MDAKIKNMFHIGLAYLGVIIGAGFASGKEMLQYFVSFGKEGIWGVALSACLFIIGGIILLQFGSYYKAQEHSELFNHISSPLVSKIIDFIINMNLFCTGFIMIAGAGTNLNQQFGLPIWMGALILSGMVIVTAYMDVDRVTTLIGAITPFVIAFLIGILIHTLIQQPLTFDEAMALSASQPTTLPNWLISTLNYSCLALMLALSMAVVIGGEQYSPKQAGFGGLFGGLLVGALLFASFFSISLNIDQVAGSSMPLLALFNVINPRLGLVMALIIFGMIYNTAIGTYYALAKRVSRAHPEKFSRNMIFLVAVGFVLSFIGFETLVAYLFPFIGYCGFFVIALLITQWALRYRHIHKESGIRDRLLEYEERRLSEDYDFDREDAAQMRDLYDESRVDNKELYDEVTEIGQEEFGEDGDQ
ncbi:YkvI family membrane protein [Aerococcus sanguinicola]